MSVDPDGTHIVPVQCTGHASRQSCIRQSRYSPRKSFYCSQRNGRMDTKEYKKRVRLWFDEVRKVAQEDILLIMVSCVSHGERMNHPGLRIEFLTQKWTQKYQQQNLEVIANEKIKYQTILLQTITDYKIRRSTSKHDFPLNFQHGRWGLNNGYLPNLAHAMTMFNKAWSKLLPSTALKCRSESQCLPMLHVAQARKIIFYLNAGSEECPGTSVLVTDVPEEIHSDMCALNFQKQV